MQQPLFFMVYEI